VSTRFYSPHAPIIRIKSHSDLCAVRGDCAASRGQHPKEDNEMKLEDVRVDWTVWRGVVEIDREYELAKRWAELVEDGMESEFLR
jgi:hypothetical protein